MLAAARGRQAAGILWVLGIFNKGVLGILQARPSHMITDMSVDPAVASRLPSNDQATSVTGPGDGVAGARGTVTGRGVCSAAC
eukprot:gene920-biopygen2254